MTEKEFEALAEMIQEAIEKAQAYTAALYASPYLKQEVFKRPMGEYFTDYMKASENMWKEFYRMKYEVKG